MKKWWIILMMCLPVISVAQDTHIQWSVNIIKKDAANYELSVTIKFADGWHSYTETDSTTGLEALGLHWDNENIKSGAIEYITTPESFKDPLFENKMVMTVKGEIAFKQLINSDKPFPADLKITLKGFISNNNEFLPIEESKEIKLEGGVEATNINIKLTTIDLQHPAAPCGDASIEEASLLTIFIKGFGGGLIALLMPCLFPMIPVTVSFFTNRSANRRQAIRKGVIYGVSILSIYLLASAPFHLLKGVDSQIFNTIATNAWINLAFFIIFIVFALSLFGLFELKLPSSLSNKAGGKSNIGSFSGIFFMALTLVIVSFSCTGPILGALLVGSLTGPWELTAGMGGFGLALALPFTLFAMFPQLLKSLPKSGGWLEVVKKSLAFVELALAIKFLSNADLVEHWGILKREVFIGSWIVIAIGLSMYLLSGIIYKKNNEKQFAWGRVFFGLSVFAFALYLIPGVTKTGSANLKLLSGFPPPISYSIYGKDNLHNKGVEPNIINDYDAALKLAKEQHKPLLIDFTGWACVNCRKMEELVWTKPEVAAAIKDNYILVSLYVDDRAKLPTEKQFVYEGKEIKTVGDKWATFQAVNFSGASQPMYVVLSTDEKLMTLPVGYTPAQKYKEWLDCGLNANKKTN